MTTNQTIDGVPRDDLELVLLHGHSTHESDRAWDRLRALLEAPPRCPVCGYTEQDCREQMDHYLCGSPEPAPANKPAAQPQGEPVAALEKARGVLRSIIRDKACGVHYAAAQAACHQINHALEQPAPVAVVRCSFCDVTDQDGNPWSGGSATQDGILIYRVIGCKDHKHLADACLAEVTRLNPSL